MNPQLMSLSESQRLYTRLKELNINCSMLIYNKIIHNSENHRDFCRILREKQNKDIQLTHDFYNEKLKIIKIPLFRDEILGIDKLKSSQICFKRVLIRMS